MVKSHNGMTRTSLWRQEGGLQLLWYNFIAQYWSDVSIYFLLFWYRHCNITPLQATTVNQLTSRDGISWFTIVPATFVVRWSHVDEAHTLYILYQMGSLYLGASSSTDCLAIFHCNLRSHSLPFMCDIAIESKMAWSKDIGWVFHNMDVYFFLLWLEIGTLTGEKSIVRIYQARCMIIYHMICA